MSPSILLSFLALLVLLLILLLITHRGKPRVNKAHFEKKWKKIEETQPRTAISEADELLEEALKRVGIRGGTTGERLNNAVGFLSNINGVWTSHKLRNQIVNEEDFVPTESEVKTALRQYKRALKDLGAL